MSDLEEYTNRRQSHYEHKKSKIKIAENIINDSHSNHFKHQKIDSKILRYVCSFTLE